MKGKNSQKTDSKKNIYEYIEPPDGSKIIAVTCLFQDRKTTTFEVQKEIYKPTKVYIRYYRMLYKAKEVYLTIKSVNVEL